MSTDLSQHRFTELDRLVAAEVDALGTATASIDPEKTTIDRRSHLDCSDLTQAEIRFLDRAADWLSSRPDPAALLQQLSDRVLGAVDEPERSDATDAPPAGPDTDEEDDQDKADDTPPGENSDD